MCDYDNELSCVRVLNNFEVKEHASCSAFKNYLWKCNKILGLDISRSC